MKIAWAMNALVMVVLIAGLGFGARTMVSRAAERLASPGVTSDAEPRPEPVVAATSEDEYCSDHPKTVLRRVLTNCGLIGGGRRGCQPGELKTIAQIDDADFNALFSPLAKRGGIVLFDLGKEDLDDGARELLDRLSRRAGLF